MLVTCIFSFPLHPKQVVILAVMNLSSANSLDLVKANILSFCKELTLCLTITTFNKPHKKEPFEDFVEKGENAGNQHFLLFPQCFLPFPNQISIFLSHLLCRLQMFSIWNSLKFCHLVKSKAQFFYYPTVTINLSSANAFNLIQSKKLSSSKQSTQVVFTFNHNWAFNPLPLNSDLTLLGKSLLKTLWEKEKMLVTSIFSVPHTCFLFYQRHKSSF